MPRNVEKIGANSREKFSPLRSDKTNWARKLKFSPRFILDMTFLTEPIVFEIIYRDVLKDGESSSSQLPEQTLTFSKLMGFC